MREKRGASQILFGFLPGQTVDLKGRIWRVKEWRQAIPISVDQETLRRALLEAAVAWDGRDGGYVADLRKGYTVTLLRVNKDVGVAVEPYPEVWVCQACKRMANADEVECKCGRRLWRQLQFVGYHDCGVLKEPYIPPCPTHHQVRVRFPGTASAAEILFDCPICERRLRKGFGMPDCACGNGKVVFTVHRAASVYSPRLAVIVNSPDPSVLSEIRNAGGGVRALEWVLGGCAGPLHGSGAPTAEMVRARLKGMGLPPDVIEAMVRQALQMGIGGAQGDVGDAEVPPLADAVREAAEQEATSIAVACASGRVLRSDLAQAVEPGSSLHALYTDIYTRALSEAALEGVDLIERFPVLTTVYGFTRGSDPARSSLKVFRSQRGEYVSYGELAETEALFFRLIPRAVAQWLEARGWRLGQPTTDEEARRAILAEARLPGPFDPDTASVGTDVLRLVHSYSHRLIRLAAVHAGIEPTALSEYLVPRHLGFFVYAAARGDFVLGGLQALFERSLQSLLNAAVYGESQCALDPGCAKAGGACMACLHIGEPSCRYFNRFVGRQYLFGDRGYLARPVSG